ncbi:hypothetical protein AB0D10_37785 [Kitasatospora sp. NPDC048545]|uniref:hypothetical protein n=1 Tax=Kitasatospora sp. NPDC048545 TaxID=3157208 RepID=UPI0033F64643
MADHLPRFAAEPERVIVEAVLTADPRLPAADVEAVLVAAVRRRPDRRQLAEALDADPELLTGWQAVPKTLVWDNEPGVGRGRPTSEFAALAGLLATRLLFCRPRDPEAKGLVERANGYLETSFLPGRTFTGPGDFNAQLAAWLQIANRRRHRTIDARPVDRWETDRAAMLAIPPVDPPAASHTSGP